MAEMNITSGPSREELFDGLRLAHEWREVPFIVDMTVGVSGEHVKSQFAFKGHIHSIERLNGDHRWRIGMWDDGRNSPFGVGMFVAEYSTQTRLGTLKLAKAAPSSD